MFLFRKTSKFSFLNKISAFLRENHRQMRLKHEQEFKKYRAKPKLEEDLNCSF
jgi:hypothetical protein